MTEEIIKVIENMQRKRDMVGYCDYVLDSEKAQHLLNYITNLQQENETLKAKLEIGKTCGFCPYYDYKQRNKKAIEYINHEEFKKKILLGLSEKKYIKNIFNDLLNILQGSDEK